MVHMDKCSKFVRWTLFTINCLVWLGGSVMLGLGIWVTTQDTEYKHLAGNLYVTIGYIVLSSFVFIIGFLGACGILLMKQTLLRVYFALMLVLLMVEVGLAVYLYLEKDKIQDHIASNWNKTSDEARIIIQQEDCYTHLMDWIKQNHIILATCSVIVAALQIFILGGTCRLLSEIESGDRSVKRTRVVPFNNQQSKPMQEKTQQTGTGQPRVAPTKPQQAATLKVPRRDSDDSEDGATRTAARRNWAKVNPKYNSVLSLLEK